MITALYRCRNNFNTIQHLFIYFQENPLADIKKIDCALLPPSRRALTKKLQRAHYVTVLWRNANTVSPDQGLSPTDFGWSVKGSLLQPTWFDEPSAPDSMFFCHANVESDDGSDNDELMVHSRSKENATQIDDFDEHSDHDIDMSEDEPWSEDSDSDIEEV